MAKTLQQVQAYIQSNRDVFKTPEQVEYYYNAQGYDYDGYMPQDVSGWDNATNIVDAGVQGDPWEPEFVAEAPPSQSTGSTGKDQWDVFNPVTGKYESVSGNYRPGDGNAIWGNVGGDRVLIRTDVDDWDQYGARKSGGDNDSDWTWGYQPPSRPESEGSDLTLGGGVPTAGSPAYTPPTTLPPLSDPVDGGGTVPPTGGGAPPPTGGGAPPNTVRPDIPKPPTETEIKPWEPFDSQKGGQTWNWDYFAPKQAGDGQWGGYDTDYGVFERYQPGQDSPWGMPDIEGGNQNFYQQQFNNLLRDEQGYRTRQRAAQLRGQEAAENRPANINYEDMWESMGVTPNQAAQGEGGTTDWALGNSAWDNTTSNKQIIADLGGIFSDADNVYLNKSNNRDWLESGNALSQSRESMQDFLSSNPYSNDKGWTALLGKIGNNVFKQGTSDWVPGTPYVPTGYASPI